MSIDEELQEHAEHAKEPFDKMVAVTMAIIAAIILTVLPEALRSVAEYRMVAYAVALIIMMLVRPKGLLGVHEVWERSAWDWLLGSARKKGGGGASPRGQTHAAGARRRYEDTESEYEEKGA